MEKDKRKLLLGMAVLGLALLTSCQVVEPEKRAYPQVIGIDWQEEEENYIVWLHMASLTEDTGQSKQSGETQPGKELYFTGSDAQEIRAAYEATREQYLDIGHVKAVVFGASLQENGETFKKVLNGMEAESSLGNSPCIFTTESLGELAETVEEQELSLGDFLTGLYENRTEVSAQSPVKLADLYRAFHKNMVLPEIPAIEIDKSIVKVSGT